MGGPAFRKILKLQAPRIPAVPLRRRAFERAGRELRPLSGPDIPIPGDQDEDKLQRYQSWRATFNGSIPEFIVWEFLTLRKKLVNGVDFVFQHPLLGGRTRFGGFILDFFFPLRNEGWRIQGERFHLLTPESRARDRVSRIILENRGIRIIDLFETDLLTRPEFVLALAFDRSVEVQTRKAI